MTQATVQIPIKPFPEGNVAVDVFGGHATTGLDVLERVRIILAPRDAWEPSGYGTARRCLVHACNDVDGKAVDLAKPFMLQAIKELHPSGKYESVQSFNDSPSIHKHHVLAMLDRAIELAEAASAKIVVEVVEKK